MPPTPPEPEPISETLRVLIDANTRPLKKIAADSGLDDAGYQRLYRWHNRKTVVLDADLAEAVYKTLTGKTFVRK